MLSYASLSSIPAALMMFGFAVSIATPASAKQNMSIIPVACAGGRTFALQLTARRATVMMDGRQLRLTRSSSVLGRRYRSSDAALIIDGDFVGLVLEDDLAFKDCHLT